MDDLRLMMCKDDWPHATGLFLKKCDSDGRPAESAMLAAVREDTVLFGQRGHSSEWRTAASLIADGWMVD